MSTYTPIATTTLGSAQSSVTFSSISGSYTDLVLITSAKHTGANDGEINVQYNGDTGNNYSVTMLYGSGSSAGSIRASNVAYTSADRVNDQSFSAGVTSILNYANTTTYKTLISRGNDTSYAIAYAGLWRSTSAINQIKLTASGGTTFTSGSTFTLYGILAA